MTKHGHGGADAARQVGAESGTCGRGVRTVIVLTFDLEPAVVKATANNKMFLLHFDSVTESPSSSTVGGDKDWGRGLTDGEAVAEVVHAVAHDDHPGDAGDAGVLHLLVRVAVAAVRVSVAVRVAVLLDLAPAASARRRVTAALFRLPLRLGLGRRQRQLAAGGRVGRFQLTELRVVVAVVAGGAAAAAVRV